MKLCRHIITIVCIVATFIANAGHQLTAKKAKGAVNQPTTAALQLLQGIWEGVDVGDPSHETITITITGNSLHFYRDTNFWFETTITLPAGTGPKQLHATINGCPPSQSDSVGEVVGAIFKIEAGTLTLATYDMSDEPPKTFASAASRYVVKKVHPKKKNAEPPHSCSASGLGSLLVEGHELHASLKTRELEDSFGHLAPDVVRPGNPHLSNEARFVEAIARSGSQGRLGSQGIRSALYALYVGDEEPVGEWPSELGFYGLEAASDADANQRENALREIWAINVRQDRTRIYREGLVLVVVWTYGVSPVSSECWEAVNASVVERLAAPARRRLNSNPIIPEKEALEGP